MILIANAFSLSMLPAWMTQPNLDDDTPEPPGATIRVEPVADPVAWLAGQADDITSVVGHADTAAVFAAVLGRPVECKRVSVSIGSDDTLLVGQYYGPRLPEGATALPAGARIVWLAVTAE